ncbi:hypothetical protein IMCC3317_08300 [Kordia antarctica]|uniref:Uncharacterized protein n=1 Tax=Kordia antarctica TaxID=1218801 RepID=A0A7L4ZHS8_9FLAO|nr:hypothetical protein [Kordia antarctica]QHI35484.1 hypothetical protein IMCC3317_08300 [Kordia antarctica]
METIEKKEPYLHILNTQGNIYEEFLPDQVLTHKNLNKVVNYFEDQDRLSRIYLIGVGIGCGMNIVSYSGGKIIIAQGAGITTDGDIINTITREFQYYGELTDRADYALFNGRQVYEIYEQEGAGRLLDEHPLTSFNTNEPGALKDYILIAYVENYTEDEGLCGGSGCDETGNKVYSNLKFLLIHKNNYAALISGDTIYKSHDVLKYYDTLPELCMPRLLLTKNNTTSGISIHDQFKNSLFLKTELHTGITTIINRFSHRINFARYGVNVPQITAYFDAIFTVQEEQFIQYKYDLLKDLIDTYREIRELILYTRFECVANINAFPKHLLLGTLEEQTRLQTRHSFYPSPTVSENDENLLSIRALCIKFFNQLKEYRIPNVPTTAIKITPSKGYEFKLSERSIPYYYETKNSLVTNWNPISIQQRKPKNQLGYHVSNLKNIPCIQEPLKFSHLDKDFYRIEGHVGKDFRLALKRVNTLKAKYNLAFDVKTISIGFPVKKITLDDDKCDTKDYAILLKTWEKEFCCTAESATEFFNKYQYTSPGDNDTVTTVYSVASVQSAQQLQLLKKKKAASAELGKIAESTINTNAESTINTNTDAVSVDGVTVNAAIYEDSLQYAIDQAYIHIGNQNVAAGYVSTITLDIIAQILGTVVKNDDYFFYTEIPVKIITNLAEIKRLFLQSLNELFNTEKWTAFKAAIEQLCTDVKQALFALSNLSADTVFGSKTHDKMYEYFIYELSKLCCLTEKFNWLKDQVDDIRNNLYRELILSKLIVEHPGAEHMAGVPKGGTFLMVYIGGTESILDDSNIVERQFNGLIQFDFALPYMCCSDCPPETIVYNTVEIETTLSIAKTKYCLPSDDGLVDFVIQSSGDGVVTSPEGTAFIVQTDAGYAFDPSGVTDELLGQTLTFLVDGNTPTVPVEICVFKFPLDVTPTYNFLSWNEAGINLDLNVSHELDTLSYFTYSWTREDGSEIGTEKDVLAEFFANPEESFVETFKLIIGVEGYQNGCTESYEVPVDETREVEISVVVPEIICHNVQMTTVALTPIIVTPDGAILTSPQTPIDAPNFIEQDGAGDYFINPVNVPDALLGTDITFEVNGNPVPDKFTRIGRLPSVINMDGQGNQLQAYDVVEWNENGVIVNLRATHAYQSQTYIEYRWTERSTGISIGDTRNVSNIAVQGTGEASGNFMVEMRVIGLEDSCSIFFEIGFTIPRPMLDIPTGICFGDSIVLDVDPEANITSPQGNFIETISGITKFESGLVPNNLVGQQINIHIDGSPVASTTVYKVPGIDNINANDELVGWDGEDVIVNLIANYTVPGVSNPQNYLEVKWFDNNNVLIEGDITQHRIPSDGGTVAITYSVIIAVRASLIDVDPCETVAIEVSINRTRPTFILERGYCYGGSIMAADIIIPVSPAEVVLTSPQGGGFIQPNGDEYIFQLSQFQFNLIGQRIGFEIGNIEVAHTFVYQTPESVEATYQNERWEGDNLIVDLVANYNIIGVNNPENYLEVKWLDESGALINELTGHIIQSIDGSVDRTYSATVSVKPELMDTTPCETTPVDITIRENSPEPAQLNLNESYCWKEDTEPLKVLLPIRTADAVLTSPQGTAFIEVEGENYVFNPSLVPFGEVGNEIQFQIGNDIVGTTRVYKFPADDDITHDVDNSNWIPGAAGYIFRYKHTYSDKNYFDYGVLLLPDGAQLDPSSTNPHRYMLDASTTVGQRTLVTLAVNGVSCTSENQVTISSTRDNPSGPANPTDPTSPLGRLVCTTSYTDRLEILGVNDELNRLNEKFGGKPYEGNIKTNVLTPLRDTVLAISRSKNLNTDGLELIGQINSTRTELQNNFLNNTNINNEDKKLFLNVDEVLELMSLELLRCVENDTAASLMTSIKTTSDDRTIDYGDGGSRIKITDEYLATFNGKDQVLVNELSTTFSTRTR